MTLREAVRASLGLLNRRDKRLLSVSIVIQMMTSVLDLIGVLLLGLVGALAVTIVQSQPPPPSVSTIADLLGLQDLTSQELIAVLAFVAALTLLTKSCLAPLLTRRVFVFLANRQALVSSRLAEELLQRPLTFLQARSSQETAYALIQGTAAATMQILGQLTIVITEATLLLVLAGALLFLDPWITLAAIAFFSVVAIVLQRSVGNWASALGADWAEADVQSLNTIQEVITSYREVTVLNRRSLYTRRIQELRWKAAQVAADTTFVQLLPKYIFEAALVMGGFMLAGVLFASQSAVVAVGTLALFLAAGTRVMPSLLRLQGAMLMLRGSAGAAIPTFTLAAALDFASSDRPLIQASISNSAPESFAYDGFAGTLELSHVSFRYPAAQTEAITDVSLSLPVGQSLAIVGSSGAGKSTLADLILGVLEPHSGSVRIGALSPSEVTAIWPGCLAYVPQEVSLASASIRQNVALGIPRDLVDDQRVLDCIVRAHLDGFIDHQAAGLDTQVGEGGVKLSGGQRQRLGLARALYSRPRLLLLDEATSALDADTEASISQTLAELEGDVTVVVIAHRLSTVQGADQVLFLEHGRTAGLGSFAEVRAAVPMLDKQAKLLGL
jgi:ABC-type multidrug transport system fused ATPase/permease subunit